MKTTITIEIDTDGLQSVEDSYLAQLWHITQANPAPYDSKVAIKVSEDVGREIIRRWLNSQPPPLWAHHSTRFSG